MKFLRGGLICVVGVALGASLFALNCDGGPTNPVAAAPDAASSAASAFSFDHSAFDALLRKYVKDGMVDYKGLLKDRAALDGYLKALAGADEKQLEGASKAEKLAFFINAYNAITLERILDHYPVKSIKDQRGVEPDAGRGGGAEDDAG